MYGKEMAEYINPIHNISIIQWSQPWLDEQIEQKLIVSTFWATFSKIFVNISNIYEGSFTNTLLLDDMG